MSFLTVKYLIFICTDDEFAINSKILHIISSILFIYLNIRLNKMNLFGLSIRILKILQVLNTPVFLNMLGLSKILKKMLHHKDYEDYEYSSYSECSRVVNMVGFVKF